MRFSTPPRPVPLSLRITNLFGGTALLGWIIFGFGSLFLWTMVMNSDFSYVNFRGEKETTGGRVTSVEETSAKESKRTVYAHHYEYSVAGEPFRGVSYATGSRTGTGGVDVEYLLDNPRKSRIAGMRLTLFSWGVQFIVIIPVAGALLMFFGTKRGLRRNGLLANGLFGTGTFVDKKETNVSENKRVVYELTFEFTGRDGRKHQSRARTTEPQRLEDEKQEPLLYDPENPECSYLLDEIPSRPKFDIEGQLMEKPSAAIRALIIPIGVIVVNVLFALHYLSRVD